MLPAFDGTVRRGFVVCPARGMLARAEYWKHLTKDERVLHIIRTYAQRHPSWVFCLYSAAVVHGISVPYRRLDKIDVCAARGCARRDAGLIRNRFFAGGQFEEIDGIRVTPGVLTMADCLRDAPSADGLVIADAFSRNYDFEREFMEELVKACGKGRTNIDCALATVAYVDRRAENGGESIARAVMIEAGIPPSDLQVEFVDPVDTRQVYRVDFLFCLVDGRMVIGELDGRGKYEDDALLAGRTTVDVLLRERQRESRLTMLGMPVVRFTMEDVMTPGKLARFLKAAGVMLGALATGDFRTTSPGRLPAVCPLTSTRKDYWRRRLLAA